ncbi:glycosyltransferase [Microbulbifer sp. CAU 1566]|uniref:glycosyltransferase n=1 Tax=Microbulbifer sp. CAU 1566 TaxID=2933269 RepID=UPI0020050C46|nr:glycosyltransferase [Microbulbifer sp. CAU 1566]MCK7597359.1 glycosyltransferase [Microbulbifer sp. CAU 1566]
MKVASIGEADYGGAGMSALKLHNEFVRQGLNSKFYVNRKTVDMDSVIQIPDRLGTSAAPFKIGQYKTITTDVPFTTGLSSKCPDFLESVWQESDVVLLRWSSVSVSDFVVSRWSNKSKPLVWCLSDMAPITGGCHYSMGCDKFESYCRPCPHVGPDSVHDPFRVLNRRLKLWNKIVFVSPSKWLGDLVSSSSIGRDKDVRVIQTGVELDVFKPYDVNLQKRKYNLDPTKPVILFGAASVDDSRKGFKYLPELVNILNEYFDMKNKYSVLVIGGGSPDLDLLNCDVTVTGHIKDRHELARAYSASDITLLPYVEDNLPNVCLESFACGVPVVAFSIGGMPDVVRPGINGELASPFDVWELAHKLKMCIDNPLSKISVRKWSEKNINIADRAIEYKDLFTELKYK